MSKRSFRLAKFITATLLAVMGCASTPPYVGQGPHPQLSRGHAIPPVDFVGTVLAFPLQLVLLNFDFSNHDISAGSEAVLIGYLDSRELPAFEDTRYKLNQYDPFGDLRSLTKNKHVGWPYRLLFGLPSTLITDVLLPGRLFPWGDYYNPYTNVAHLYSDDPTILLHEAGHAYDLADYRYKGLYSAIRNISFTPLYQEWQATDLAIEYLMETNQRDLEMRAYRSLWPAYGSYLGSFFLPIPYVASFVGAIIGHPIAYFKVRDRRQYYERMDRALGMPSQSAGVSTKAAP